MKIKKIYYDKLKRNYPNTYQVLINQLVIMSKAIDIPLDWILDVMYVETGRTLHHATRNILSNSTAYGYIQMTPVARNLVGVSYEKLRSMNEIEQLNPVQTYFQKTFKSFGKPKSNLELYYSVFSPKLIKMKSSDVLFKRGTREYNMNRMIDVNYGGNNGDITKADFDNYAKSLFLKSTDMIEVSPPDSINPFTFLPLLGVITFFLKKYLF